MLYRVHLSTDEGQTHKSYDERRLNICIETHFQYSRTNGVT
jgi:hypothetical protein